MTGHSDALAVLRSVYRDGLRIAQVDGATPVVRGGAPSPELKVDLKEHKAAILDMLKAQRIGERDDGYASPVPRRYVVPPSCLAERACSRLGPCGHFLTRRGCGGEVTS